MQKNVITLADDNGFEIIAHYTIGHTESQQEEGHGYHEVGDFDHVELISLEVYFCRQGIDIADKLNEKQLARIEKLILESI
jgi:hypothetical protein